MPDTYGSAQPDSLELENRNWESAFLLKGRSIQTSDINLVGSISSTKNRESLREILPSGFLKRGDILTTFDSYTDSLSEAKEGDVVTTLDKPYGFFLISKGNNWAVVDGMLVNVSGTGQSYNQNNFIDLEDEMKSLNNPATNVILVFLEVWRKSVSIKDSIYRYGNLGAETLENDLFHSSVGYATAGRVQVQYRIRSGTRLSASSFNNDSNGLSGVSPLNVRGESITANYKYKSRAQEGDSSLYIAGDGSNSAKQILGTVDGYVYAIPMFLVSPRREGTYSATGTIGELCNAPLKGSVKKSPRPDGKFCNILYDTDILDLRRNSSTVPDIQEVLDQTLAGIMCGGISTRKGTTGIGSQGGSLTLFSERVANGTGDGVSLFGKIINGAPRRAFLGGSHSQPFMCSRVTADSNKTAVLSLANMAGDLMQVTTRAVFQDMTPIVIPEPVWNPSSKELTLSGLTSGVTYHVVYDLQWYSADENGFTNVPSKILQQVYSSDLGTTWHYNATKGYPQYLAPLDSSNSYYDTDRVQNLGDSYKDISSVGQVAILTKTVIGGSVTLLLDKNRCLSGSGQKVLGVHYIKAVDSTTYLSSAFYFAPDGSAQKLVIPLNSIANGTSIEISLHLGTKSCAFSRSGRGVTETYQSYLQNVGVSSSGTCTVTTKSVDSHHDTLVGLCGMLTGTEDAPSMEYYVLNKDESTQRHACYKINVPTLDSNLLVNSSTPVHKLSWVDSALKNATDIQIPLRTLTWLQSNEIISVVYETRGYQGIDIPIGSKLSVLGTGAAYITSMGSGIPQEKAFPFIDATITRVGNHKIRVSFTNKRLLTHGEVLPEDYLYFPEDPYIRYRVRKVEVSIDGTATELTMYDSIALDADGRDAGVFVRGDKVQWSGAIDQMPSVEPDSKDYMGLSVSAGYHTIKAWGVPDVILPRVYSVKVDSSLSCHRGRRGTRILGVEDQPPISMAYPNAFGTSTVAMPYKIFQPYLVREQNSGILYMMVISSSYSSGSLAARTSPYWEQDAVDLFELKGRVQIKGV